MRYFNSEMWSYRNGAYVPHAWKETNFDDERKFLAHYCQEELYVYDSDNCSHRDIYFAFSTGKFFLVEHSLWWEYVEDEDGGYHHVANEFEVTEVPEAETKKLAKDRDWLIV